MASFALTFNVHGVRARERKLSAGQHHPPIEPPSDPLSLQILLIHFATALCVFPIPPCTLVLHGRTWCVTRER